MEPQFTPIENIGEFELIDRVSAILGESADPDLILGIGDDAAVFRADDDHSFVLSTDMLVEGVHFDFSYVPLSHLGAKAISSNVSDVAAMNALPSYATISLGIPPRVSVEMVEEFYRGIRQACDMYEMTIVGGDVSRARQFTISVAIVGRVETRRLSFRRGAQPGDLICVTGDAGSAFAGLKVLLEQQKSMKEQGDAFVPDIDDYRTVINRQLMPAARVDVIKGWHEADFRPNAMIDTSDGLASEVNHLCRNSQLGALVDLAEVPVLTETNSVAEKYEAALAEFVLYGGEDYELMFAINPNDLDKLNPSATHVIGTFTAQSEGVRLRFPNSQVVPLEAKGFKHF
ncbi:MAG: thiamine-phosphate kinase [Rhodothermales bacterium]|nr:thiamine-phosphate kinase [Rhodothermales bacterium]